MIHFYTDKCYIQGPILERDTEAIFYFFTQELGQIYFDDIESNQVLMNVEGMTRRERNIIENSISITSLSTISTGCKAVLVATHHPDTCITNLEMGDNAMLELYRHSHREIHVLCEIALPYQSSTEIAYLDNQKMTMGEAIEQINDKLFAAV